MDGVEPHVYAYLTYTPDQFLSFSLDEAAKVIKGLEIKMEAEDYRWNGQMQILRWIGSIMWNKPVYGYKASRAMKPEKLFSLPGDKKEVEEVPQATKKQVALMIKKAKLLKGVI